MKFDRRTYLERASIATVAIAGLAGCLGGGSEGGDETGTLSTSVTDQPMDIGDFESLVVTIVGLWLGPRAADTATSTETEDGDESGREYYEFDSPAEANLVELQDGSVQLVDERELETAEYAFLQLDTDGIDATLTDGSEATVETPGNAPLTFNEPFEIREQTQTSFTADFTPVKRGQTATYVLQPVAQGIDVSYEDDTDA